MLENCSFAERLSELMIDNNLNTVALGNALGVDIETIRRWKNFKNSISLVNLIKLADFFNCSLDFLAGRSEIYLDYPINKMPPFFQRLRLVMCEKGITRYRIVKELLIYDSYFTKWKSGHLPTLYTLICLADYLDVSIDYLVGREQ